MKKNNVEVCCEESAFDTSYTGQINRLKETCEQYKNNAIQAEKERDRFQNELEEFRKSIPNEIDASSGIVSMSRKDYELLMDDLNNQLNSNPLLQLLKKNGLSDVEVLAQYLQNAESLQDDNNYWKSRCAELQKKIHDIDLLILPIILDKGYPIIECDTVKTIINAFEAITKDCEKCKSDFCMINKNAELRASQELVEEQKVGIERLKYYLSKEKNNLETTIKVLSKLIN